MFTGIIQSIGRIKSISRQDGDMKLIIDVSDLGLENVQTGDSIAVNGVCLTAVAIEGNTFVADVSVETLDKTSLSKMEVNNSVNLEKALTLNTALGGHLVSGHVDGPGIIQSIQNDARSIRYTFEVSDDLQHYIAIKGSVTIDGTSLTINHVEDNRFDVNIVPHTQLNTIFQHYQVGSQVNIEVDIIARYLERLITGKKMSTGDKDPHWIELLSRTGFTQ
ncbi:MAG: riboflavin synthase [Gammaproteobacteria bacterium]|jgi:riboflavin synthase